MVDLLMEIAYYSARMLHFSCINGESEKKCGNELLEGVIGSFTTNKEERYTRKI